MKNKIELLAPAGGMRELKAAVQSGADAVYLGAADFSARSGAGNFTADELAEAVRYAHGYGVKVHCAINTLIKEKEMSAAIETAICANDCGVDALIIQDVGLASRLRELLPDIELHGSTQMTVTSLEGVRYLEKMGFSRVVLARELSVGEIERIVKGAKAEIEIFVHGAICMSYSGQCLMSSVLGGRSGNRGRCAQPCRLPYELIKDGKPCGEGYVLSPKDMALVRHLDEIGRIGVASLKIEGRLKSAEYVSTVVGVYRKYLDGGGAVTSDDMAKLTGAFSRSGFTDGYFTGRLGADMMAHKNPANNSGSIYTPEVKAIADGKIVRRIPINVYATLLADDVLRVYAYDSDGNSVSCEGTAIAETARNKPITAERVTEQLCKVGDTPFAVEEINVEIDEGITVPVKELNAVRREMCRQLWELRTASEKKRVSDIASRTYTANGGCTDTLTAKVRTFEQGVAVLQSGGVKRLYAPSGVAKRLIEIATDTEIVTYTSDILSDEPIATENVCVGSFAAMEKYGERAKHGDFRLNVYNADTICAFEGLASVTLSPELNLREIADVTAKCGNVETELIAYGYLPLMIMRNCPVKAMGHCQKNKDIYSLRDRKNTEFKFVCGDGCRAILLNSKPIFTADIMDEIKRTKINCIRLDFTVENPEQCGKIIDVYRSAVRGEKVEPMEVNTFTRGHLHRGVQ